jgi:hypothetical protein
MASKAEIIDELIELGIDHAPDSTKATLQQQLDDVSAPVSATGRPVWEGGETRQQYHDRVREWKLGQAR